MTELPPQDPLRGGAVARPGFFLCADTDTALLRLSLHPADREAAGRAAAALGRPLPPPGTVAESGAWRVAGVAPGRWLFLGAAGDLEQLGESLDASLAGDAAVVVPVGDGQVVLRITGARRNEVLARATAIDLDGLATGRCAAARVAGIAALLLPESGAMLLVACRSLAVYLRDWFDAASVDCC